MYRLPDIKEPFDFPDDLVTTPDGLLAVGGNLHPITLIHAYAKGIFPWFSEGDPLLWWYPKPRMVLFPEKVHVSHSMKQLLLKVECVGENSEVPFLPEIRFQVRINTAFDLLIRECSEKRGRGRLSTWIVPEMLQSYSQLNRMGFAHSIEVWNRENEMVGGLYGVILGKVFFGESMFSHEPNASKVALITLCQELAQKKFVMIDCQVATEHLKSMGATEINAQEFGRLLKRGKTHQKKPLEGWQNDQ